MRWYIFVTILFSQLVFTETILKGRFIKDVKSPGERIFLTRLTGVVGEKGKFVISVDDINYENLWNNSVVVLDLYEGSHNVCVNVVADFTIVDLSKKTCIDIDLKDDEKKFFILKWKSIFNADTVKFIPETSEEFLKN
tara:strand:+ start:136 stop:549 length:414 start_codon:yes stop_codon:yes gene_type:complete